MLFFLLTISSSCSVSVTVIRWIYFYPKCICTSFFFLNIVSEAPLQTHLCCLKLRSTLDSNTFTSLLLASDHLVLNCCKEQFFPLTPLPHYLLVFCGSTQMRVLFQLKLIQILPHRPADWEQFVVHSFLKGDIIKLPEALNFWLQRSGNLPSWVLLLSVSCIFSLFPFHWASAVFWLVYLIIS